MRTPRTYAIAALVAGSGLLLSARCGVVPAPSSSPTPGPIAFPLKVSPNKRYVTDQHNVPILILEGFTPFPGSQRLTGGRCYLLFDQKIARI
jgi:hypothetical protein